MNVYLPTSSNPNHFEIHLNNGEKKMIKLEDMIDHDGNMNPLLLQVINEKVLIDYLLRKKVNKLHNICKLIGIKKGMYSIQYVDGHI